jgi:HK97 gp10 family phage protein
LKVNATFSDEITTQLDRLGGDVLNRIMRKSVSAACDPIVSKSKSNVRKRSGATAASMTKKVKGYKQSGNTVGMVGPDSSYETTVKGKKHKPAKIAHLIEFGHVVVRKNRKGEARQVGVAPAYPFMRPAMDSSEAEVGQILEDVTREGLMNEVGG